MSPNIGRPGHPGTYRDVLTGRQSVNRPYANTRRSREQAEHQRDAVARRHRFHQGDARVQVRRADDAVEHVDGSAAGTPAASCSTTSARRPYYVLNQEPYAARRHDQDVRRVRPGRLDRSSRATINLGLRYDRTNGSVPSLEQLDSTLTPTGKTFPGVPNVFTLQRRRRRGSASPSSWTKPPGRC